MMQSILEDGSQPLALHAHFMSTWKRDSRWCRTYMKACRNHPHSTSKIMQEGVLPDCLNWWYLEVSWCMWWQQKEMHRLQESLPDHICLLNDWHYCQGSPWHQVNLKRRCYCQVEILLTNQKRYFSALFVKVYDILGTTPCIWNWLAHSFEKLK